MTLGEKVKQMRLKKGYSLRKLASMVDVSASFLCQLESGKTGCTLSTLARMAKALGVNAAYLVDEGTAPPGDKEVFSVTTPNSQQYIGAVTEFAKRVLSSNGLTRETCNELVLVVEELATNIVKHAYPPEAVDTYTVSIRLAGDETELTFTDKGKPFDPTKVAESARVPAQGEQVEGSLGLQIVRTYADRMEYTYDPSVGNVLKVYRRNTSDSRVGEEELTAEKTS